jgi:hypothetical protein
LLLSAIAPVRLLLRQQHQRPLLRPRHNQHLHHSLLLRQLLHRLHLHQSWHRLHQRLHPRQHLAQSAAPKVWCCLPLCASSLQKTDSMCLALLVLALVGALRATM